MKVFLSGLLLLLMATSDVGPRAQPGRTEDRPVAPHGDAFGVSSGLIGPNAPALLKELGVGWVRVNVNWLYVEPEPGKYNWEPLENYFNLLRKHLDGVQVLVTIRAVREKSDWAGRGEAKKPTVPPRDRAKYAQFVRGVARRGTGLVSAYQIENEMESEDWWTGTSDEYIELLRTAHDAIRRIDSRAYILPGGFTSGDSLIAAMVARGDTWEQMARQLGTRKRPTPEARRSAARRIAFMEEVLAKAGPYVDAVDMHYYHEPDTIAMKVRWLRETMRKHGYERPIWLTEMGGPDITVRSFSEAAQVDEVSERVRLASESGVAKMFWLCLFEGKGRERWKRMGLVRADGTPKPVFHAYKAAIEAAERSRSSG